MDEFFRTQMGHRFFEATLPRLVRELARLNDNLEALAAALGARAARRRVEATMRIKIVDDGRVLQGTAEQIVQQMQYLAFGREDRPLAEYVDWLAGQVARLNGVALTVEGATGREKAESLVRQMLAAGLAEKA